MLLLILMLIFSFIAALVVTGIFTPDLIQWYGLEGFWWQVGIFTLIGFIIFLGIYENGRKYLEK